MWTWWRSIADAFMSRTGNPSRLDTSTRMAMDADFSRRRETVPQRLPEPPRAPADPDPIEELMRLVGDRKRPDPEFLRGDVADVSAAFGAEPA
jgi:hypothetical protein